MEHRDQTAGQVGQALVCWGVAGYHHAEWMFGLEGKLAS